MKIAKDANGNEYVAKSATYAVAHAFHNVGLTSYESGQDAMGIRREIFRLIKSGEGGFSSALDAFEAHASCFIRPLSHINVLYLAQIQCGKYHANEMLYVPKSLHR